MSRKRTRLTKSAVRTVEKHGYDGQMQRAAAEVQDPFESTKTVAVIRNIAAPIENLYSRGRINSAQFAAAQRYKRIYDEAAIGGARAIDYAREHVDGGAREQISVKALEAGKELAHLLPLVGKRGALVLSLVVGEETPIGQVVKRVVSGINDLQGQGYIVCRLIEALDALVEHWGLIAMGNNDRKRIRVSAETTTGPQAEWTVGRFGDLVQVPARGSTG